MQDEFETIKNQAEEYLNNWKRERADFINYKKEEAKRVEEIIKFANEGLVLEIIDVLDKLDLGLKHEPNETMKQLVKDFEKLLNKYGVERIRTDGDFDPILHEAVASRIVGEQEDGGMKELRSGYIMNWKVIRPARVSIQKIVK